MYLRCFIGNITKESGPVSMTFTIPMYNASGLQVITSLTWVWQVFKEILLSTSKFENLPVTTPLRDCIWSIINIVCECDMGGLGSVTTDIFDTLHGIYCASVLAVYCAVF